jgi:hypothetical protein
LTLGNRNNKNKFKYLKLKEILNNEINKKSEKENLAGKLEKKIFLS